MVCETRERLFPNNAELLRVEVEDFLRSQGVTSIIGLRAHADVILGTLRVNKGFDLSSYKVDPENVNRLVME